LPNLRTTDQVFQIPPIEEIVETLLVEAGCAQRLPTDENQLLDFLELRQMSFDFMQDSELRPAAKPQAPAREIRAVLSLNDRVVATQPGLNPKRKRFGILHEVGHFINHEHLQKLFYDTDETLSWWTRLRIEREANEVAAQLLFQGNRFTEEALGHPLSVRTAVDLAPKYDASFESALWRYTERHALPCALIVFDKANASSAEGMDDYEPEYKLQYTITSAPFRKEFFSGLQANEGTTPQSELLPVGHWGIKHVVEREIVVNGGEKQWTFDTEVVSNGYKVFQFILPPKESLGR
jgi:Zn-dependent peptidase ImmA (M78 family)